jgi:hypothetical protein
MRAANRGSSGTIKSREDRNTMSRIQSGSLRFDIVGRMHTGAFGGAGETVHAFLTRITWLFLRIILFMHTRPTLRISRVCLVRHMELPRVS